MSAPDPMFQKQGGVVHDEARLELGDIDAHAMVSAEHASSLESLMQTLAAASHTR